MNQHQRLEVQVTRLSTGGEGVGHVSVDGESRAVFVPRSARGDVAMCDVDFRSRPARGRIVSLLTQSTDRVTPACESFGTCGGCDFLHLTPAAQMKAHEERVLSGLRGLAHPAPTLHSFAPSSGARTRARLHVVGSKRGVVTVGFFQEGSHDVTAVRTCIALHPALDRARDELPALLRGSTGKGEAQLGLGPFEDARRAVVSLSWSGSFPAEVFGRFEKNVNGGGLRGVRLHEKGAARAVIIGDPTPVTRGADGQPLVLGAGGFAQAIESSLLPDVVIARAKALLDSLARPAPRIVELYAGAGNFSVALAPLGALTTCESNAEACEKARENLRARGLTADVRQGDAESFGKSDKTDLLVLDPPRTGARAVAEAVAASPKPPRSILYVSCDPETLARDLVILGTGYQVHSVDVVPCFPDTSHVEVVVALIRTKA